MRNPVNRLATAAPRALDSLLSGGNKGGSKSTNEKETRTSHTTSFDLDQSILDMKHTHVLEESSSSVVTFEELADMIEDMMEGEKSGAFSRLALASWTCSCHNRVMKDDLNN
jgi:hypothetical protein